MSLDRRANDWECVGVAQAGGGIVAGGGVFLYEFRSRLADFRGVYLFVGVGAAVGGGFGGTTAPSPGEIIHNKQPDLWGKLKG